MKRKITGFTLGALLFAPCSFAERDIISIKSEFRNPKQTQIQIDLKSGKSETPNPNEACLEFYIFVI